MIFAFAEDASLSSYENEAEVQRSCEGVDVENGVFSFYNEDDVFLEPIFVVPNKRGKTLGLFPWVESGTYKLVPNPTTSKGPFAVALFETAVLHPNRWFRDLTHLKSELSSKGVVVELNPRPDANGSTDRSST